MLSQLDGLQVVEEERDLPLFAGSDLLAGLHRPVPFISGITRRILIDILQEQVCDFGKKENSNTGILE